MKRIKKLILFILLLIFIFLVLQEKAGLISSKPLGGYFEPVNPPVLSYKTFMDNSFQQGIDLYCENTIPFRPDLVRLYNQIDFTAFNLPHAKKIVVGKQQYLYEEPYIKAYLGKDFIGKERIDARVRQFRELQDLLWREKHILMIVIFTPDKGSFYPEYIPGRYLKSGRDTTNYQLYKQGLETAGVNFIDFNQWFLQIKDTSRYLLYPKTGIHWSAYGAYLCMDSLIRFIDKKQDLAIPAPVLDSIQISPEAISWDEDIYMALNLIWNIPHPPLAYPKYHYRQSEEQSKPSALFVGDSFYFCWSDAGYIQNSFRNEEFWYYDHDVYINRIKQDSIVEDLNLEQSLNRQNILIFIQTNAGYGNAGYGFVDRALKLLTEKSNTGK